MELHQLAYFRVVAGLEHMSRAADEFGITQPSLSRAIKRLEQEVGVPLFDRHGRGIRLNQFGKAYLRHVDNVMRELDGAKAEVRELAGLQQGNVSLAAAALSWLPDLVRPFLAIYPAVQFQLFQRSMVEMRQILEEGSVDLCVLPPAPMSPTVRWRHLSTRDILLVVPVGHLLAGRSSVALREVALERVILSKPGDVLREITDGYFRQAGIRPRIVCEADEPGAVEEFVAAGIGVAFLPDPGGLWNRSEGVRSVRITEPACYLRLGIAWNERRYLSLAARSFRAYAFSRFVAPIVSDEPGEGIDRSAVGSG